MSRMHNSSVSTVPPVNSRVTVYDCKTHMFMGRIAALLLHAHCWVGMALSPEMPITFETNLGCIHSWGCLGEGGGGGGG
ncbi:unnamed protein product, partial [Ixodes pacificus]